jgi:isoaspartyl peptidase/L-asparaginase-like protein (Ntn-hydrolase superfamily)
MNQPKEIARQTVNYMLNNGMDPVAAAHLLISTIADECFPHIGMIEIDREGTHLLWRAGFHLAWQQMPR